MSFSSSAPAVAVTLIGLRDACAKMCGHLAISSYATPGEVERKGEEKSERLALHAAKDFALARREI